MPTYILAGPADQTCERRAVSAPAWYVAQAGKPFLKGRLLRLVAFYEIFSLPFPRFRTYAKDDKQFFSCAYVALFTSPHMHTNCALLDDLNPWNARDTVRKYMRYVYSVLSKTSYAKCDCASRCVRVYASLKIKRVVH
jgi:hypothetical protein